MITYVYTYIYIYMYTYVYIWTRDRFCGCAPSSSWVLPQDRWPWECRSSQSPPYPRGRWHKIIPDDLRFLMHPKKPTNAAKTLDRCRDIIDKYIHILYIYIHNIYICIYMYIFTAIYTYIYWGMSQNWALLKIGWLICGPKKLDLKFWPIWAAGPL